MWNWLSFFLLFILLVPLAYLMVLMVASAKRKPVVSSPPVKEWRKFIIAIAAHDEAAVIENTVRRLLALDYPSDSFSVHVVADHCSDATASLAKQAGAVVYERSVEPRSGKGAALTWLFEQLWQSRLDADAIIVFDADTVVDKKFPACDECAFAKRFSGDSGPAHHRQSEAWMVPSVDLGYVSDR